MIKTIRKVIKDPITHFLALGIVLFLIYSFFVENDDEKIFIKTSDIQQLIKQQEQLTGKLIDAEDSIKIANNYIDDELLFREAGKHGMDKPDLWIRKRIADKMRLSLSGEAETPNEKILSEYYQSHKDNYRTGLYLSLVELNWKDTSDKLLINSDTIDAFLNSDAAMLLLMEKAIVSDTLKDISKFDIIKKYGKNFSGNILESSENFWIGPIPAPSGVYFVKIIEKSYSGFLPFESVRPVLINDYLMEQQKNSFETGMSKIRKEYKIKIEQ